MEDCTESHQTWNEMLGEQSRSQAEQHCRPLLLQVSTPLSLVCLLDLVLLYKAYLALIVQLPMDSAESSRCHVPRSPVQPSKLVFSSSGIEVTSEHAVNSGFSAESSVPVQGTSCVDRAVSHGFDGTVSGGSCGKDTSPAHLARSQPDVGTQYAHVGYPGVE